MVAGTGLERNPYFKDWTISCKHLSQLNKHQWNLGGAAGRTHLSDGNYRDVDASAAHSGFYDDRVVVVVLKEMTALVFPVTPENVATAE